MRTLLYVATLVRNIKCIKRNDYVLIFWCSCIRTKSNFGNCTFSTNDFV